jgi:hypothetical protein
MNTEQTSGWRGRSGLRTGLPAQRDPGSRRLRRAAGLREVTERSLRQTGLRDEAGDRQDKPGGLSGGQRLGAARSLAVQPQVPLTHEPCPAPGPVSALVIEQLISGPQQECTTVIVTRSMRQAARISGVTAFFTAPAPASPVGWRKSASPGTCPAVPPGRRSPATSRKGRITLEPT